MHLTGGSDVDRSGFVRETLQPGRVDTWSRMHAVNSSLHGRVVCSVYTIHTARLSVSTTMHFVTFLTYRHACIRKSMSLPPIHCHAFESPVTSRGAPDSGASDILHVWHRLMHGGGGPRRPYDPSGLPHRSILRGLVDFGQVVSLDDALTIGSCSGRLVAKKAAAPSCHPVKLSTCHQPACSAPTHRG